MTAAPRIGHQLLNNWAADYAPTIDDVHRAEMVDPAVSVDELFGAFFTQTPRWLVALMRLRNAIVGKLGFEVGDGGPPRIPAHPAVGDKVGLFTVLDRSDNEILFGGVDRHFALGISMARIESAPRTATVAIATVGAPVTRLGAIYLRVISLGHGLAAKSVVKRCAQIRAADSRG